MRIGVDLGDTKIEAAALNDQGDILIRERVDTPTGDYRATIQAIVDLVAHIEQQHGSQGSVGIATPGAISPTSGLLKNSNSTCLNQKPLQQDLEKALGRPIRMANDADCFALSEATDGVATGANIVFGVIVGTGTGGGIVVNGKLISGPNAIAGEWGHNPLPWPQANESPGPDCYCGKQGCIETWLSGPGMSVDYFKEFGERLTAIEISTNATAGEQKAELILQRYENRMARSLASIINVLDPDVIVLGGGMSNMQRLYENVPLHWGEYAFSDHVDTKLVQAKYGDSSGVRGAAWLWN